jgi:hypothetical protein
LSPKQFITSPAPETKSQKRKKKKEQRNKRHEINK